MRRKHQGDGVGDRINPSKFESISNKFNLGVVFCVTSVAAVAVAAAGLVGASNHDYKRDLTSNIEASQNIQMDSFKSGYNADLERLKTAVQSEATSYDEEDGDLPKKEVLAEAEKSKIIIDEISEGNGKMMFVSGKDSTTPNSDKYWYVVKLNASDDPVDSGKLFKVGDESDRLVSHITYGTSGRGQ